jgi:hypothetical protein
MTSTDRTIRSEQAIVRAFRAAMAEYEACPCLDPEDDAYTAITASTVAHWELDRSFDEPVARSLADALAKAACKSFRRKPLA